MKSRWFYLIIGMLLGIALAATYTGLYKPFTVALHNMATGPDAERSNNLVEFLTNNVPAIKVGDAPSTSTVTTIPRRNSTQLNLYGVTNSKAQFEVVSTVRQWQSTNTSMKEVSICFYDRVIGRSEYGELLPKDPFCKVTVYGSR
ncbi:MAG TPA: hypothetical protein VK327_05515 [Candidatus Paceibacterota bacterium]|nr:hypothetical protein [Candidatus Paceibacterota bacterium]